MVLCIDPMIPIITRSSGQRFGGDASILTNRRQR
jgi:hypothetical protein